MLEELARQSALLDSICQFILKARKNYVSKLLIGFWHVVLTSNPKRMEQSIDKYIYIYTHTVLGSLYFFQFCYSAAGYFSCLNSFFPSLV